MSQTQRLAEFTAGLMSLSRQETGAIHTKITTKTFMELFLEKETGIEQPGAVQIINNVQMAPAQAPGPRIRL